MTETMIASTFDEGLHDEYRAARTAGPAGIAADTGAVVVLRYGDIERLSHDPRLAGIGLSVFDLLGIEDGPLRSWYSSLMFTNEGDAHHRLRRLAARVFTPRSIERHRSLAARLADERMATLVADGGGDLVAALVDVPITVICTLIGVPDHQIGDFVEYGDALSPVFGLMDPEQVAVAERAVVGLMRDVEMMIDSRRTQRGDDLISGLLDAEEQGDRLTHDEVVTMVGNLIVGGHDTTSGQVSCSLLTLLRHPDVLAALRVDTALAPAVANETIRFEPSITIVPRTVLEPLEIGGVERPVGSMVFLASASASRDEAIWGDPDIFRPTRFIEPDAPKLLSFGSGPHYCLGAALARMTMEEVVLAAARAGLGDTIVADGPIDADSIEWRQILGRSPARLPVTVRR
ncbi:MAG TPA: cytochrome P450 [Ilumatobacteraceae bacterium]|nr:cytochrome P450 [Ilumatobacteraceae bacterium]